jgi:hypothetical protein
LFALLCEFKMSRFSSSSRNLFLCGFSQRISKADVGAPDAGLLNKFVGHYVHSLLQRLA